MRKKYKDKFEVLDDRLGVTNNYVGRNNRIMIMLIYALFPNIDIIRIINKDMETVLEDKSFSYEEAKKLSLKEGFNFLSKVDDFAEIWIKYKKKKRKNE